MPFAIQEQLKLANKNAVERMSYRVAVDYIQIVTTKVSAPTLSSPSNPFGPAPTPLASNQVPMTRRLNNCTLSSIAPSTRTLLPDGTRLSNPYSLFVPRPSLLDTVYNSTGTNDSWRNDRVQPYELGTNILSDAVFKVINIEIKESFHKLLLEKVNN